MFDSFASSSRFDFVGKWYDIATGRDKWIETEAFTTSCSWQDDNSGFGGYLVRHSYLVDGEYYDGHFHSDSAVDLDTVLPVRYKPSNPRRKYLSGSGSGREPLVLFAVAGGFGVFWLILHLMSRGIY
jgi:hypothetical protein